MIDEARGESCLPVSPPNSTRQKRRNNRKLGSLPDLAAQPLIPPQTCPECGSMKLYKDGLRRMPSGSIQRYLCRNCGYRFSQGGAAGGRRPLQEPSGWPLKRRNCIATACRVNDDLGWRVSGTGQVLKNLEPQVETKTTAEKHHKTPKAR